MRIAIAGLNPGSAMYAYYMAKDGHEVTVYTELQGDVVFADLMPHALLGIVNRESIKLFTRKYLEDILGMHVINTSLKSLIINGNKVVNQAHGVDDRYDKVVVGSEVVLESSGNCLSIYSDELKPGKYAITGKDIGKNLEASLLVSEIGGSVSLNVPLAIDGDIAKSLPINRVETYNECINTDYKIINPIISEGFTGELVGRGFTMRDSLSGLDYIVNRDYQLVIRGKLLALRDLGVINSVPTMPRLEVGFSRNYSFLSIGLTRDELGLVFRDLSSSRIAYHGDDGEITGKVLHRGNRLLSLQLIMRGIKIYNWFYYIYSLIMLNSTAYLIIDMGYERLFGTLRGLIEQLILDTYNI